MIELLNAIYDPHGRDQERYFNLKGSPTSLFGRVADILDDHIVVLRGTWGKGGTATVEVTVPAAHINFYVEG